MNSPRFTILKIVYACPKCARIYEENGKDADAALTAQIECPCGFKGEVGV